MTLTVELRTRILPGHRIEIEAPELPEGRTATVRITLDDEGKRPLHEILGEYSGKQLFQTADEVDAFLRAERQSWDR